ncbi:auxin efflux carrier superfamily protein-like protein [Phyllosticta citrichinensis]|uniref:Auxin efflux carrier superfamily protein-like protein n=1 Tax=Phyllosticta citrichinensis TaxID=1130410 RepID=A0ABR1Y932_9PEZI
MHFAAHRPPAANDFATMTLPDSALAAGSFDASPNGAHSSHPNFLHLTLLVFEAVMEVVCVSLPGYIVARQGMFDANAQKLVANLNVQLFTPCLIFTKLASQLTADKLVDLAIIPVIFVILTLVSWGSSQLVGRLFGFKRKRPLNFITAMAVFANSNSLPISLVLSLSKTIQGLHWDQIPGDNDDEVGARGILYLLIFQQLGQLVRWTWGYQVLLRPASEYDDEDMGASASLENGDYEDSASIERRNLLEDEDNGQDDGHLQPDSTFASGSITPVKKDDDQDSVISNEGHVNGKANPTPTNGNAVQDGPANLAGHRQHSEEDLPAVSFNRRKKTTSVKQYIKQKFATMSDAVSTAFRSLFESFPEPVQKVLSAISAGMGRFLRGLWEFMNPPLWAMLAALIVASVPPLQHLFFDPGTFINNSVTRAVKQSGGVAVPLILVVLGANLARNTLPKETAQDLVDAKDEKKLLIASLVSRMVLPTIVMAPILAVLAKYAPVSIIDDPIFMIVCFLLTGAPSALQLAQICQLNNVYMGAMSKLLFQSYVVWILPSTLILVMLALEVVEWSVGAS